MPDLTLGADDWTVPAHATDHWPVAPGHELPAEAWEQVKAEAQAIASRRSLAGFTYAPLPYTLGSKDSGPIRPGHPDDEIYVLHTVECPLAPGYARSLTRWGISSAPSTSWTVTIGPDEAVGFVPADRAAWHATWINRYARAGLEHTAYAAFGREQWLTPAGVAMLTNSAKWLVTVARISPAAIRMVTDAEVARITAPGRGPIKGFVLHSQVQPRDRTDTGKGFPADVYLNLIRTHHPSIDTPTEQPITQEDDMSKVITIRTGGQDFMALLIAEKAIPLITPEEATVAARIVSATQMHDAINAREWDVYAGILARAPGLTADAVAASVAAVVGGPAPVDAAALAAAVVDKVGTDMAREIIDAIAARLAS